MKERFGGRFDERDWGRRPDCGVLPDGGGGDGEESVVVVVVAVAEGEVQG